MGSGLTAANASPRQTPHATRHAPRATRHAPRADEDGSDQMRNAFVLRCTDARGQQGAETGATRIDEPAQSVLMPQQSSNS
jgi:hypothetical protein